MLDPDVENLGIGDVVVGENRQRINDLLKKLLPERNFNPYVYEIDGNIITFKYNKEVVNTVESMKDKGDMRWKYEFSYMPKFSMEPRITKERYGTFRDWSFFRQYMTGMSPGSYGIGKEYVFDIANDSKSRDHVDDNMIKEILKTMNEQVDMIPYLKEIK
jgi:hypothetical protein